MVLAQRIEAGTPKDAILEAYVNRLPMGGDLVGVEAGARTYFGTPASELDLAHAALLAALPNDPVRLDPYAHRAALEARRRDVLARMVATGAVSADDAARAAAERVDVLPRSDGIAAAPHLLFRLAGGVAPDATRVRTTIDSELQAFVENATRQVVGGLSERRVRDGAAIVIDNRDGRFSPTSARRTTSRAPARARTTAWSRCASRARRSSRFCTSSRSSGASCARRRSSPTCRRRTRFPDSRAYSPGDYSERFAGPVRARIALADSLNVPAVRVLSGVGVAAFLDRLRALGFRHLTKRRGSLRARARARRRRGDARRARGRVRGASRTAAGRCACTRSRMRTRATRGPRRARIGEASEWALVTDMLADAHARARAFGVASLLRTSFPSAVKTGTSSDFRDTWTVGFTRDYTVAAWVGNFDGAPMQRVSGVTGAAPLWNRIMRHLAERAPPAAFAPPRGYVRKPMCATTGVRPTRDCDSVVGEWLDARDLVAWNAPPRPLDRSYDGVARGTAAAPRRVAAHRRAARRRRVRRGTRRAHRRRRARRVAPGMGAQRHARRARTARAGRCRWRAGGGRCARTKVRAPMR